jgi:DEAD/DEAH box helicase domain-containing protein
MTDRNDLGGISIPHHEQVGAAAVFVYDGAPGGVGLSRLAYDKADELLSTTLATMRDCECDLGCPSCVHSPKCGSGNRPIAKDAAIFVMERIMREQPSTKCITIEQPPQETEGAQAEAIRYGVLDIETRRSAQEVGGWNKADRMGVSVAVLYDSVDDSYYEYEQDAIPDLLTKMQGLDTVIGFNVRRFDYAVLSGVHGFDWWSLPTLDMLEVVHGRLGYRLSLDHLATHTLGAKKTADGLLALEWWKAGEIAKIAEYCRADVCITNDLYMHGRDKGFLLFRNKAKKLVRLPVEW